jgi:hypothetical protein
MHQTTASSAGSSRKPTLCTFSIDFINPRPEVLESVTVHALRNMFADFQLRAGHSAAADALALAAYDHLDEHRGFLSRMNGLSE